MAATAIATMADMSAVMAEAATAAAPSTVRGKSGLTIGAVSTQASAPGLGMGGSGSAEQGAEQGQCQAIVTQGVHGENLSIQPLAAQAISCYA
jgi:hypothetical protein